MAVRKFIKLHSVSVITYSTNVFKSDQDLGHLCQGDCETDYVACTLACSDPECLLECGRNFSQCSLGEFLLINSRNLSRIDQIVRAMNIVRMVVLNVLTQFAFVVQTQLHKTKKTWKRA